MLQPIVEFSIRRRGVVIALAAALLLYGVRTTMRAKLDVFPDFVQPQAVIQTEAPGLSPEQVEMLVTRAVEGAVGGITNLESMRSQSIQGLSIVTIVFNEGTDIFIARQLLNEQLSTVIETLPAGVKPPKLTPLTSSTMDLLKLGLVSDRRTQMELRTFADWTLRPRLQAVPGVAQVGIMGGDTRQLQIQIDPERLAMFGLAFNDVLAAARESTGALGAGFIETMNQCIVVQSDGQSLTAEQLGNTIVRRTPDGVLRLKDFATVCETAALKFGDATIQGRPGVLVKVLSQYGSNTMEVTEAVEAALAEMSAAFKAEGIDVYPRLHRPATFIETSLHHVRFALFLGGALVVVVLMLFLFNLRTAFISIMAIPLSLLTGVIVLEWLGQSLNTITLGGLAIAIGEVVDDAIIDVENILRRVRENRRMGMPRSPWVVVLNASLEVRSAVVYATFIVVLVFIPVLTMSGLQGRMFAPLGMAYISAILASLWVALTVTPALACLLLPNNLGGSEEPVLLRRLRTAYSSMISRMIRWRGRLVVASLAMGIVAVGMFCEFGDEFLPEFREGHFVAQVNAAPGTSLPEMMRIGRRISDDFLTKVQIDGKPVIDTVEEQAGRAELGEDPWGPHRCEFHIELKPNVSGDHQRLVQEQFREILESYPGVSSEVVTFLGDRISETLTGETSPVVVNIFGENLDALDAKAQEIATLLTQVSGHADVRVGSPPGAPQVRVTIRPQSLTEFGFQPMDVLRALQTAYQGDTVAQVYQGNRVYDVVVILPPHLRQDPESIGSLLLRSQLNQFVPLREMADIDSSTGRYMLLHDNARRRQTVTCGVAGRDIGGFVAEVRERLSRMPMPNGMYATIGGAAEAGKEARAELLLHSAVVGLGVFLLLAGVFGNAPNLFLVLLNLPFAFVGGVFAVYLTGKTLSIGSIVGFVTLFGITMRNSVMMMSHYDHLVKQEGAPWGVETAIRGAAERLIPILMTALVTGLGLLPIALGSGEVGREIEGPMAIVILGGLVSSTLLNLLVLPTLAARFARFAQTPQQANEDDNR